MFGKPEILNTSFIHSQIIQSTGHHGLCIRNVVGVEPKHRCDCFQKLQQSKCLGCDWEVKLGQSLEVYFGSKVWECSVCIFL